MQEVVQALLGGMGINTQAGEPAEEPASAPSQPAAAPSQMPMEVDRCRPPNHATVCLIILGYTLCLSRGMPNLLLPHRSSSSENHASFVRCGEMGGGFVIRLRVSLTFWIKLMESRRTFES